MYITALCSDSHRLLDRRSSCIGRNFNQGKQIFLFLLLMLYRYGNYVHILGNLFSILANSVLFLPKRVEALPI